MFRDPDTESDLIVRRYLTRKLGRTPTANDISKHYEEERIAAIEANRLWEREEAEKAAELQRQQAARRRILDERLKTRSVAPVDFLPVGDVEGLERLSKSGQAFCEGTRIEGSKGKPVIVALDLELFNLRRSTFRYVRFGKLANLSGANFDGSIFDEVDFEEGSNLEGADFASAELNGVRFRGASLEGATFQFAKFKKGVAVEFDRNYLFNATFAATRTDSWFRLSHAYSGVLQYINLTLSGAYFGFLLLKLYLFRAFSLMQDAAIHAAPQVESHREQFSKISVYEFVFGSGVASLTVALTILIYQAMRLYLTMRIGPLIEAERQTGYSPRRSAFESYLMLHFIARALGVLALLFFLYELWELWRQPPLLVPNLPKNPN